MPGIAGIKKYVARYTGNTPHILAFQVVAVAPAHGLKGDQVLPRLEKPGQVKFSRQFAVFAVSHKFAVDP